MESLWHSPAVHEPTKERLLSIANKFNLDFNDDEIEELQGVMGGLLNIFTELDQLTEPRESIVYPRKPGYRPTKEENPYNAWYWKTEIHGADNGKLKGKTVAIKDNIAVAGVPMMCGSRVIEGYTPDFDATVVTRLLDEGATVLGKATTEDLCICSQSFTSALGPVLNPRDRTRSAGGSSSGSAVLVAINEVDLAVGGDQAGSIRVPASFNGLVGLKPTYGLISYTGAMSGGPTLDHLGPMAKTVFDCALMLEVLAGYDDGKDFRQTTKIHVPEYSKNLTWEKDHLKIALLEEACEISEKRIVDCLQQKIDSINEVQKTVDKVSIRAHTSGINICLTISAAELNDVIFRHGGIAGNVRGQYQTSLVSSLHKSIKSNANNLAATVKLFGMLGEYVKEEHGNKYAAKAQNLALWLKQEYDKVLESYDVIVMPTVPLLPIVLPTEQKFGITDIMELAAKNLVNTASCNVTGHPAITVNGGFVDNMPVGIMLVGKHFDEMKLLQVAKIFENSTTK